MSEVARKRAFVSDARIDAEILAALGGRNADSSVCPSEIARALAPNTDAWRALMPRIRGRVSSLGHEHKVTATRGDRHLPPDDLEGGPIRIRRGRDF